MWYANFSSHSSQMQSQGPSIRFLVCEQLLFLHWEGECFFLSDAVFYPLADLVFVACCVLTNRQAGKAGFGCLPWQVLLQQNRAEHVSFSKDVLPSLILLILLSVLDSAKINNGLSILRDGSS